MSDHQAHISNAEAQDLPHLAAIESAAARLFPRELVPDPDVTLPLATLQSAQQAGLVLVAKLQQHIVGFAANVAEGDYLHLEEVSVDPEAGRRGIGTQLVNAVIELAVQRQFIGVSLTTFASIPWNAPFYRRLGFVSPTADDLPPHLQQRLQDEQVHMRDRVGMLYPIAR